MPQNLDSGAKIGLATFVATSVGFGPQGGRGDSNPRPLGSESRVLDHWALGGHFPWGIVPQEDNSPGESSPWERPPWGIVPQGNHPPGRDPPGESSARGIVPLGETPLGNRPPGESFPRETPQFRTRVSHKGAQIPHKASAQGFRTRLRTRVRRIVFRLNIVLL